MSTNERDTHFQNAAKLLVLRIDGLSMRYKDWPDWRELDKQIKRLIAQFAYDLVRQACIEINNAQVRSGGAILHPNAMLREVSDLDAWPEPH